MTKNIKNTLSKLLLLMVVSLPMAVQAAMYTLAYDGWFTLYDASGGPVFNASAKDDGMQGWRTAVSGVITWNDVTQVATDDINPYQILGGTITLDTVVANAIGDGQGGEGTLIMGNTTASWAGFSTFSNIPGTNIADIGGLLTAINGGVSVGDTITGGSLPASNDTLFGTVDTGFSTLPIGPSALASTFFNATDDGLPLTLDDIPGTPFSTFPFAGYSGAFDIPEMTVVSISAVPVPAAVWLFGSGLIGLLSFARRKRAK